jgi:hypothetical protein
MIGPHARKTGRQRTIPPTNPGPVQRKKGLPPRSGKKRKTQTEVVVLVERENAAAGNLVMRVVEKATRPDIRESVELRVENNKQWFKSDAYQSHYVVKSMGHQLQALPLAGSPISCEELPVVHRAISLLKRFLMGTYHGVSARYLQRYAQEFSFRWNRRSQPLSICESLLRACVFTVPMTYAELKL